MSRSSSPERLFVGCSECAYDVPSARSKSIPRVPAATLSVVTSRGVRQLCEAHAASLSVAPECDIPLRDGSPVAASRCARVQP
jgi:hypothetical protein